MLMCWKKLHENNERQIDVYVFSSLTLTTRIIISTLLTFLYTVTDNNKIRKQKHHVRTLCNNPFTVADELWDEYCRPYDRYVYLLTQTTRFTKGSTYVKIK